ncbi:MAG: hypothetical protein MI861_01995 [Pirellulales bacterium]|nr:hypothetical protein [Pirellulales bacterium]
MWFVVAASIGLNAYLVLDSGLRFAISEILSNPVGWAGPTCVFVIISIPLALLCRLTVWENSSVNPAYVQPVLGGLIFGCLALQIDRWLDTCLSSLGQNPIGLDRTIQFGFSMVLTGMLSIIAQYVTAAVWKRPVQPLRSSDHGIAACKGRQHRH